MPAFSPLRRSRDLPLTAAGRSPFLAEFWLTSNYAQQAEDAFARRAAAWSIITFSFSCRAALFHAHLFSWFDAQADRRHILRRRYRFGESFSPPAASAHAEMASRDDGCHALRRRPSANTTPIGETAAMFHDGGPASPRRAHGRRDALVSRADARAVSPCRRRWARHNTRHACGASIDMSCWASCRPRDAQGLFAAERAWRLSRRC